MSTGNLKKSNHLVLFLNIFLFLLQQINSVRGKRFFFNFSIPVLKIFLIFSYSNFIYSKEFVKTATSFQFVLIVMSVINSRIQKTRTKTKSFLFF